MPNNNRVMPNNTITIILAGMAPHRYFTEGTQKTFVFPLSLNTKAVNLC